MLLPHSQCLALCARRPPYTRGEDAWIGLGFYFQRQLFTLCSSIAHQKDGMASSLLAIGAKSVHETSHDLVSDLISEHRATLLRFQKSNYVMQVKCIKFNITCINIIKNHKFMTHGDIEEFFNWLNSYFFLSLNALTNSSVKHDISVGSLIFGF